MKRVTGIGGIFFKAKDAPQLQAWYKRHWALMFRLGEVPHSVGQTLTASPLVERLSGLLGLKTASSLAQAMLHL